MSPAGGQGLRLSELVATRLPVHAAELAGQATAAGDGLALSIHDAFLVAALVCSVRIATSLCGGTRPEDAGSIPAAA